MSATLVGLLDWKGKRDKDGHREYDARFLVRTTSSADGPVAVLTCPGLPAIGSYWDEPGGNDPWALCQPDMTVSTVVKNEPNFHWYVDTKFSTKPINRCQSSQPGDPLSEPPKISGTFSKFTVDANFHADGTPIVNSAGQPLLGIKRDANRPTVRIELNYSNINLAAIASAVDTVNDSPLWGLPARCIKLSNASWSRKFYGTCSHYYTVAYDFDISFNSFDEIHVDRGPFCVSPDAEDRLNPKPSDLIPMRSYDDTPVSMGYLDGAGNPTGPFSAGTRNVYLYGQTNFLLFGLPSSL